MAKGRKDIVKDSVPFSKENQPTPEAKKKGWAKKRLLKDIAESIVSGDMKDIASKLAKTFGLEVKEIDLATLADLRQLEKAVKTGDTRAYNAVMDRLRGKPKQSIVTEDRDGNTAPLLIKVTGLG